MLAQWLADQPRLGVVPPQATGFAFLRVLAGEESPALEKRLRAAGVLVAPGACFGIADHFRLCHTLDPDHLPEALERIGEMLARPDGGHR